MRSRQLQLLQGVRAYRLIQLQQNCHNFIMGKAFNSAYIFVVTPSISLCAYGCVKLYGRVSLFTSMFFPLCLSMMPVYMLFITEFFAYSNEESLRIIKEVMPGILIEANADETGRSDSHTEYLKRMVRACPPLKCWIGDTYFMERSLKLVWLSFCSDLTIYFLLTF